MRKRDRIKISEDLKTFLDDINREPETTIIIVEGKHDMDSLRSIGVNILIYCICGKNINTIVQETSKYEKVVILTDFDCEGKKIKSKLVNRLQEIGVKIDLTYSKRIKKISQGKISQIEGLNTFLKKTTAHF